MYPHRIRLRGPWTLTTATGQVVHVNVNQGLPTVDSTLSGIQLARRFSWVQPLQPHERLWLVLERSTVTGGKLNDRALELAGLAPDHQECEVTSLTQRSNQLVLDVPIRQTHERFPEVALEVRCRTFLRHAAWRIDPANGMFEVTGLLVGTDPSPLELYARVGEVNVLYAVVRADQSRSAFRYQSEIPAGARDEDTPILIDLVKGGVIWHRVSGQLGRGQDRG
jgi:hypothetical protein